MKIYSAHNVVNRNGGIGLDEAINVALKDVADEAPVVIYTYNEKIKEKILSSDLNKLPEYSLFADDIGRGGGSGVWGELSSHAPLAIYIAQDIVLNGLLYEILKQLSRPVWEAWMSAITNYSKVSCTFSVNGEKNSIYKFHLFSFFTDRDYQKALLAIPEAVKSKNLYLVQSSPAEESDITYTFFFDTRQEKWFEVQGESHNSFGYKKFL